MEAKMGFFREVLIVTSEKIKREVEPEGKRIINGLDVTLLVGGTVALMFGNPLVERVAIPIVLTECLMFGQVTRVVRSMGKVLVRRRCSER